MNEFVMPQLERGMTVDWYPTGQESDQPCLAYVGGRGAKSYQSRKLTLHIWTSTGALVRDAVPCMDDPAVNPHERSQSGCWRLTQWTKALMASKTLQSAEQLAALLDRVTTAEAKIATAVAMVQAMEKELSALGYEAPTMETVAP